MIVILEQDVTISYLPSPTDSKSTFFSPMCVNYSQQQQQQQQQHRYECTCKESEGWFDNTAAERAAYGDVGCFDARPPKAFLKCVGSARLDVVHESMRQVFDDVSKDLNFADCEPAYDTVQQTEAQHCKCAGEVDTYVVFMDFETHFRCEK